MIIKEGAVILIDGFYYLYSVYYAFPNLRNSIGEPTNVIYGFISILRSIFMKYKPSYMVVVFDCYGKTFRDNLFRGYKFHRKPMPVDLSIQIPIIYKIVEAMGFSVVVVPGVEADDIIGTLSVFFSKKLGYDVYIFSGDKDMLQLVTVNVYVVNSRLKICFAVEDVAKKYKISSPNLLVDYLSLLGDRSDNIPGVPGIGKVTARFLLWKLGNLSILYKNLDKVSKLFELRGAQSIALRLNKYRSLAFLSYELVTIKTDIVLSSLYDNLLLKSPDIDLLIFLFRRCEFRKWVESLISRQWLNDS